MVYPIKDRPALTEAVSSIIQPFLRAWTDQVALGDPEFDQIATGTELAEFLGQKVQTLL